MTGHSCFSRNKKYDAHTCRANCDPNSDLLCTLHDCEGRHAGKAEHRDDYAEAADTGVHEGGSPSDEEDATDLPGEAC